ncbi:MAG: SRPBCC family protein [Rhodothermales bacterium]
MITYTSTRTVKAPISHVFDTVSNIENFSKAIPHIINVEFLSDVKTGVGAKFRETRIMNGRETKTDLEVTSYEENQHVRLVSDSHGTVWDTVFTFVEQTEDIKLKMVMEAKSYKLSARIMGYFIKGMVQKALDEDMDAVQSYCEAAS